MKKSIESAETTSIKHRLQSIAKEKNVSAQLIRTDFLLERLLARIAKSPSTAASIVFKGGIVSKAVYKTGRFTRDIDLAPAPNCENEIIPLIKEAITKNLNDGCWFAFREKTKLQLQSTEGGTRLRICAGIGEKPTELSKATNLSIDVTFSSVEQSSWENFPPLLGGKSFRWQVCAPEVTIADKISALLTRGSDNTRSRDIYDLALMLPRADRALLNKRLKYIYKILDKPMPKSFHAVMSDIDTGRLATNWYASLLGVNNPPEFQPMWNVGYSPFNG